MCSSAALQWLDQASPLRPTPFRAQSSACRWAGLEALTTRCCMSRQVSAGLETRRTLGKRSPLSKADVTQGLVRGGRWLLLIRTANRAWAMSGQTSSRQSLLCSPVLWRGHVSGLRVEHLWLVQSVASLPTSGPVRADGGVDTQPLGPGWRPTSWLTPGN